jgi:hypothetical protein
MWYRGPRAQRLARSAFFRLRVEGSRFQIFADALSLISFTANLEKHLWYLWITAESHPMARTQREALPSPPVGERSVCTPRATARLGAAGGQDQARADHRSGVLGALPKENLRGLGGQEVAGRQGGDRSDRGHDRQRDGPDRASLIPRRGEKDHLRTLSTPSWQTSCASTHLQCGRESHPPGRQDRPGHGCTLA